ncbi:MAG: PEP-CTERM sorting domain-containing protein [Calothrix sp. MO_192.B10]|nr:PEP-CTERM sorting domain-containing protein [Calothrix sp. MO_192.B10]
MKFFNDVLIASSTALLAVLGSFGSMSSAQAAAFSYIRIGDVDGFGYGQGYDENGEKYQGAYGGNANIDGRGTLLGVGDVLPDLNQNGKLATEQGDDFDNRSESEKNNNSFTGTGRSFQDNGSSGSKFTDISLSTSYINTIKYGDIISNRDERERKFKERRLVNLKRFEKRFVAAESEESKEFFAQKIQEQKELIEEKDGGIDQSQAAELESLTLNQLNEKRNSLTTEIDELKVKIDTREAEKAKELGDNKIPQATFDFDFSIGKNDIVKQDKMYLNLLFADYDVKTEVRDENNQLILDENNNIIRKDAEFEFTRADGTTFRRTLTTQKNRQGEDGLIQGIFVELDFDEIFQEDGDKYNGKLTAKMIAPDEPYLAFDFAELSTKQISMEPEEVPEPTAIIGLLAFGAFGASSLLKRKKQQPH